DLRARAAAHRHDEGKAELFLVPAVEFPEAGELLRRALVDAGALLLRARGRAALARDGSTVGEIGVRAHEGEPDSFVGIVDRARENVCQPHRVVEIASLRITGFGNPGGILIDAAVAAHELLEIRWRALVAQS